MITTLLFDLDGTLLDTIGDLAGSVNFVLSRFSFPTRSMAEIRSFIGNGVPALLRKSLPENAGDALHAEAIALFTEHYLSHIGEGTKHFPGLLMVLHKLSAKGYKLGVVSNKRDDATKLICERYLSPYITFALGASGEGNRKPKPDMIYEALSHFHSAPSEALYIGDSNIDIQTAGAAGMDCISVCWGYRDRDFLLANGAKTIAETPESLYNIILTF